MYYPGTPRTKSARGLLSPCSGALDSHDAAAEAIGDARSVGNADAVATYWARAAVRLTSAWASGPRVSAHASQQGKSSPRRRPFRCLGPPGRLARRTRAFDGTGLGASLGGFGRRLEVIRRLLSVGCAASSRRGARHIRSRGAAGAYTASEATLEGHYGTLCRLWILPIPRRRAPATGGA